jgi:predicted O-methyltransferase YrrM
MVRDKPLHNFLFETDPDGFYEGLHCPATPWIDVCVLLHLIRRYRPARFLEVGTHRGDTTRILADKFPAMSIVTVDPGDQVPDEERPSNQLHEYLPQAEIGELVADRPNVQVIKQKFRAIDWGKDSFDMIFIDGNHSLPDVLEDSQLALRLLSTPGVITWHDYDNVLDVNRALAQLALPRPIVSIHNTWMAYYDTH